jgi:catechol 2,3-dioxygenase-like lactoylglutathione lyase family enzyme
VRDLRFRRIAGFGVTSADAARLTEFYATVFGARPVSSEYLSGARFGRGMGVRGGALRHTLKIGDEMVNILQFDTPGQPYPRPLSPRDTTFQHFAIVVRDMGLALAHLARTTGWTPISRDGPQHLPERSGGVTAFKFQDPDGHPLELLAFPEHAVPSHWKERSGRGVVLGIDHSAISVRDTAVSAAFYETLAFRITARTLNHGAAQARLDGVPSPEVEVTALSLEATTPHLELLCYRSAAPTPRRMWASNDVAATRITLAADGLEDAAALQLVTDPDGHHLLLMA